MHSSLIGDSRVKGFKEHALTYKLSDNWSKPGARINQMEDLIRDCIIMHHGEDSYKNSLHIYISAGICDITKRLKGKGYEEVIVNLNEIESTKCKIIRSLNDIQKFTLNEGATPIFTTIYPMSLHDWNNNRLCQRKTTNLQHVELYPKMQTKMEEMIREVNTHIININVNIGVATPLIHKHLVHNRGKGNSSYKFNMLNDGCHPNQTLKIKIANSIAVAIKKNVPQ
jgi:lysophospholipase L1-like esterase